MADEQVIVETVFSLRDQSSQALARINTASDHAARNIQVVKNHLDRTGVAHRKAGNSAKEHARHVEGLGEHFRELGEKMEGPKEHLLELGAAVGVSVGIYKLAESFVELNSEAEQATRKMGAMLAGLYNFNGAKNPAENLSHGLARANELMEKLGKTSVELGVGRESLAGMASALAPAVAAAGKDTNYLVGLTGKLAALSRVTGQNFEESAQSMTMAVRFGVAHRSPLMQMLGIHGSILAKMTAQQRLNLVQKRLAQFSPEALSQVKTFSDLVGRVRAQVKLITEEAGKPLFEAAKGVVADVGQWITDNRDKIKETADLIGKNMVTKLHELVDLVKVAARYWDEIKATIIAAAGVWATLRVGGEIKGLAQSFQKTMMESGTAAGTAMGNAAGMAAKGVMVAEAFAVGWAIGSAIGGYLEKQSWFNKLMTPEKSAAEKAVDVDVERIKEHDRQASAALDQFTSGGAGSAADLAELKRQAKEGKAWVALHEKGLTRTVQLASGDVARYMTRLGVDLEGRALPSAKAPPKTREAPDERAKNFFDFSHSSFDITQKFNENYDPDRIAVAFTSDLAVMGERRLQSGFAPLYTTK